MDFREKAELCNSFFANQCSFVRNSSVLPTDFELFTDKSLPNIPFAGNDIGRITSGLDPNKAHGHNMTSIRTFSLTYQKRLTKNASKCDIKTKAKWYIRKFTKDH